VRCGQLRDSSTPSFLTRNSARPSDARACKLLVLLVPAIKECRLVSVCPPTARPPPITCTRQPRRAPFTGRLPHSLCATIEIGMCPATFISIVRESHRPRRDGPQHTARVKNSDTPLYKRSEYIILCPRVIALKLLLGGQASGSFISTTSNLRPIVSTNAIPCSASSAKSRRRVPRPFTASLTYFWSDPSICSSALSKNAKFFDT
jgi:hypothetical protein